MSNQIMGLDYIYYFI